MKKRLLTVCSIMTLIAAHSLSLSAQWVNQTSGTTAKLRAVQFLDASNGYAGGNAGTVLKTTNGGTTWTNVSIPGVTAPVMDISFVNATTGWAAIGDTSGFSSGIWKTSNGGTSWTSQTSGSTTSRLCISFVSDQIGWASGADVPIKFNHTTNGGTSYTIQPVSNIYGWVYALDAVDANTVYTAMPVQFTQSGLVAKSTNGGSTWTAVWGDGGSGSGSPGNKIPYLYAMDFVNASTGYVVGFTGSIHATTNGGTSWTTQSSNTTEHLDGVSFATSTTGFICGRNGTIRSTTNGGTAWTTETSGVTVNLQDVSAVIGSASTIAWAVGDNGTILKGTAPLGISEASSAELINVYPNPSHDYASIEVPAAHNLSGNSLKVYDVLGRDVTNKVSVQLIQTGEVARFDIALHLDKGVYSFVVTNNDAPVTNGRLIVN